jgi:hypothetical protein
MISYCDIDRSSLAGDAAGNPAAISADLDGEPEDDASEDVDEDKSYPLTPAPELPELALTLLLAGWDIGPLLPLDDPATPDEP